MTTLLHLAGASIGALALSTTLQAEPRTAFVHLFEWQWNDIAYECENHLGPAGYAAVQVSPPQKSIDSPQWWSRYQPVSYAIEGRSGNRAEFADMVNRCSAAGVDIYVDAVINHMAAWDRNFPEVPYTEWDFHTCTDDVNYSSQWSIQNCDLVGLNDLATEKAYVRQKIADYMNDITSLGVAGFRIDAAKHMPADDINAIKQKLIGNPYIFQEVIGSPGEPVQPSDYNWISDVTEFNFTKSVGYYFKRRGPVSNLKNVGTGSGWLPSDDAITFVANHDNQRQDTDNTITHKDSFQLNKMAHVFTLGWPYGYPKVMSSYDWNDHDQGPPSHGAASCSGGWLCEHRSREIANMVGFRNATASEFRVTDYWDNGSHQMAWGRGGLGFVVLNMEDYDLQQSFQTGMPAGTYCDIIQGDYNTQQKSCSGPTITVNANGYAPFSVYYRNASAIHVNAKVVDSVVDDTENNCTDHCTVEQVSTTFTCRNGDTYWGQSVYVIGNLPELGNWNTDSAVELTATSYPTWRGSIDLPANTEVQWKCIKRDATNPNAAIVWQSGVDNQLNTGTSDAAPSASF